MKKIRILVLCAIVIGSVFTGCGSRENSLVTKTPFPSFSEETLDGKELSDKVFTEYKGTIVNFWNNGCGSCIEEMPELEELYGEFQKKNINLIGVGTDSGESREQFERAKEILKEKKVTYQNISPNPEQSFYREFVSELSSFPVTYVVDREGNVIGAPVYGNVKKQMESIQARLETGGII